MMFAKNGVYSSLITQKGQNMSSDTQATVKFFNRSEFADMRSKPPVKSADGVSDGMRVRETTIEVKGMTKKNNLISVIPSSSEQVALVSNNKDRFEDLKHLNIILTNACNLACSYCYEQHTTDYGRFTVDSLKRLYDFLYDVNPAEGKLFQFFGGEPLIHKPLILDFIRTHQKEIQEKSSLVRISMITNGTLLTEEFIDEYFANDFVNMSISLDTDNKDVDHREVTQDDIENIMAMIGRIPTFHKSSKMVSCRCTISRETAPHLRDFGVRLYNQGLRVMVIHPLTMSAGTGNIQWPPGEWERLHDDILWLINNMEGFDIQFSEGVGSKKNSNCMVGSDMIAVDASGDFAGCYFFTNQKSALRDTVLGNIFENQLYIDRYKKFQDTYDQMFEEEEQCRTCDLKGFCYQCPAGNMSTGHKQMFRPDSMCKSIVSLFIDLQNDNSKKVFKEKYLSIVNAAKEMDPELMSRKMVTHLMYKKITGYHLAIGEIDNDLTSFPDHEVILGRFKQLIENGTQTIPCACAYVPTITGPKLSIRDFYIWLLERSNVPAQVPKDDDSPLTVERSAFYFALVHMVILNIKGDNLMKTRKLTQL